MNRSNGGGGDKGGVFLLMQRSYNASIERVDIEPRSRTRLRALSVGLISTSKVTSWTPKYKRCWAVFQKNKMTIDQRDYSEHVPIYQSPYLITACYIRTHPGQPVSSQVELQSLLLLSFEGSPADIFQPRSPPPPRSSHSNLSLTGLPIIQTDKSIQRRPTYPVRHLRI